jgi:hypothetical protein
MQNDRVRKGSPVGIPNVYEVYPNGKYETAQDAVDAAIQAGVSITSPTTIVIHNGVMPLMYETIDGTATGAPLSSYGITVDYAPGAWSTPMPPIAPAQPLSRKKMTVVLACDDGDPDWLKVEVADAVEKNFGGIKLSLDAGTLTYTSPLYYMVKNGLTASLALIGDNSYGDANNDGKMSPGQVAECIVRGGFERTCHSMNHSDATSPALSAANAWEEICASKLLLNQYTFNSGWIISKTGTVTGGTFDVLCDDELATVNYNASADELKLALDALLTSAGYTGGKYKTSVSGGKYNIYGTTQAWLVSIGDGTTGVEISVDSTNLIGGGTYDVTALTPRKLPEIQGFVYSGDWTGEAAGGTSKAITQNAVSRLVDRNYRFSRGAYNGSLTTLPLLSPYDAGQTVAFDMTTATPAAITAGLADTKIIPGSLMIILIHHIRNHTDPGFLKLVERLAQLQAAGQIEVVNMATATNCYLVDSIPNVPGGDIASLSDTTFSNNTISVSNAAYFAKATLTNTLTESSTWLKFLSGHDPRTVAIKVPVIVPGRTHTFQFTCYTEANPDGAWLDVVASSVGGFSPTHLDCVATSNNLDKYGQAAYARELPEVGKMCICTYKVFVPDDTLRDQWQIELRARMATGSIWVTDFKWFPS